jgi:hypothetical protein
MRGDLILYKSQGRLFERFITHFTKGPFVHVSIDLGDGSNIGAHPYGITRERNPRKGFVRIALNEHVHPDDLKFAMRWLWMQVGKKYGWVNIVDSALGVLGLPIYFFQRDHNDCSTLAAKYLIRLNGEWWIDDNPDLVSPNDIARFFNII